MKNSIFAFIAMSALALTSIHSIDVDARTHKRHAAKHHTQHTQQAADQSATPPTTQAAPATPPAPQTPPAAANVAPPEQSAPAPTTQEQAGVPQ